MTSPLLTAAAVRLLEDHLHSYEKLEVLHAVHNGARAMSRAEVIAAARLDESIVVTELGELQRAGFIAIDAAGLATLGAPARTPACEEVLGLYAEDRGTLLPLLSAIAMGRIRSMTARAFADAFVIRKKRGDQDG